ncbi:(2Fe-2S)-binding protein [Nioella aestuarii]|uniref:(2Fe-2S)-binding protein n=1 Tax=Nioella aestuarii TaxID=1662864 RepID=UPI003D7F6B38
MPADSAFTRLSASARLVPVQLDGADLLLPDGENLAASLLAAGVGYLRHTPGSGKARAPFCMMGACFDCLIEIDGVTRQACMMTVTEGLIMTRPKGATNG